MKYYVIGDEDAVLGFGMVGVRGRRARNASEAAEAFREALSDREIGIILITERIAELIRPQVDRYVFSEGFPPDRGDSRLGGEAELQAPYPGDGERGHRHQAVR